MGAARDPDQADFDLERFINMFDEAMTSKDPRVMETLRSLMMIVTLTRPETAEPLAAKRGRVVVTNIHPAFEMGGANMSLLDLTLMEKQVVGSLFGSGNPRADIPKLLGLYREGQLDLDGLVTKTYPLEGINEGYQDMRDGKNIRGVLVYE